MAVYDNSAITNVYLMGYSVYRRNLWFPPPIFSIRFKTSTHSSRLLARARFQNGRGRGGGREAEQPPGGGARVVEVALQAEAPAAHLDHADHGYPPALPRVVLVGCMHSRVHLGRERRRDGFGSTIRHCQRSFYRLDRDHRHRRALVLEDRASHYYPRPQQRLRARWHAPQQKRMPIPVQNEADRPPRGRQSPFQILYFLIRNTLCPRSVKFQDERIPCPRGGPPLILSWAEQNPSKPLKGAARDDDCAPILLMLHGLMCDANDLPGTSFTYTAVERGWKVVVFNRPGHREPLKSPRFSLGDYRDLDAVVDHITSVPPIALLGSSGLGGMPPALKYLGEKGRGFAMMHSSDQRWFVHRRPCTSGWFFSSIFVSNVKKFFLVPMTILRAHSNRYERPYCTSEHVLPALSPFMCDGGTWKDAKEVIDPLPTAANIKSPCLFINAIDDPIVPVESVDPYMDTFSSATHVMLRDCDRSHCPF